MSNSETKTRCNCGCMGAGPLLTDVLRRLGPSDAVRQHFTNAHLEVLKGIRAFVDEQIAARGAEAARGTHVIGVDRLHADERVERGGEECNEKRDEHDSGFDGGQQQTWSLTQACSELKELLAGVQQITIKNPVRQASMSTGDVELF